MRSSAAGTFTARLSSDGAATSGSLGGLPASTCAIGLILSSCCTPPVCLVVTKAPRTYGAAMSQWGTKRLFRMET